MVDTLSSLALIGFGLWVAVGSWRELHEPRGHYHGDAYHFHENQHDGAPHSHDPKRTALLLILGSSPMIEGIPAFFAGAKYGVVLIISMAILFAASTIATYVLLCVYSAVGIQRMHVPVLERYGEVLSGAFITILGVVFLILPVL